MKQKYFRIANNTLKILHQESIRLMFYQVAGVLFLAILFPQLIVMAANFTGRNNVFANCIYMPHSFDLGGIFITLFVWGVGIIIPVLFVFLARHFPPAPEILFHKDIQNITWKNGDNRLEIPFSNIHFATSRLLSKSGISTVMVAIFALDDKPFFKGEIPSADPEARYRKDLCVYKAGTQEDADESIEIIKSFMAGTYDESSSKFDDL